MKKFTTKINFEDERGYIQDILFNCPVDHTTLIYSKKGVVRGDHYHKETTQYTYILSGKAEYYYATEEGPVAKVELSAGEYVVSPPLERHTVKATEDMTMIAFTKGPRGGDNYEDDTYRLEQSLVQ